MRNVIISVAAPIIQQYIENSIRLLSRTTLSSIFIARYPDITAAKNPARITSKLVSNNPIMFLASTSVAPSIAGMDIKKLNLAASSRFIPTSKLADIVAPDLDIPGSIAQACPIPTNRASLIPVCSISLVPDGIFSAINSMNPVIMRKHATSGMLLNACSM